MLSAISLFAAIAFAISHSSTQSRVDRLSADVVKMAGLKLKEVRNLEFSGTKTTIVFFEGEPHDADTAESIVKMMKDSFPDWKYTAEYIPASGEEQPLDDEPYCWFYSLQFGEAFQPEGWLIQYTPNDEGYLDPEHPVADFVVIGPSNVSLLDRIKGWLPWLRK